MKRISFTHCIAFIGILLMILMPIFVMAEGDPGTGGCDPLDPTCPIDGGLSALLAVGVGYGIRKVRQARKAVDPE